MRRLLLFLFSAVLLFGVTSTSIGQTLVTHDFDNGVLSPYEIRKSDQEARVNIVNGAVETHWKEALYNDTNSGRKAQFMPIGDPHFTQHIWMGLSLKIHSDYMKDNGATSAGLMQIWGYNGVTGSANHMCMLTFDGSTLFWQHRYNSVSTFTNHEIYSNFPRDEFVDIIIHVQLSEYNKGIVQVWVDGELAVNETNQVIGWGDMNADGMYNETYCFGTSLGQYNFDPENYVSGETRTVTYDNVSLYNGADGYELVDPNPGDPIVMIRKRNASSYALDGSGQSSNGQNVYLWGYSATNVNQQWEEIDRGNGYYSYQKVGTNYSLDGGNGGATNQNVYLWSTDAGNYNQHWQKVDVGSGYIQLRKRNSSGYGINGGSGGVNGQNVNLYDSSNPSQNLQWMIEYK